MPKKSLTGKIVSKAMQNTVVVAVERMQMHPLYNKAYRVTKKYHADSSGMELEVGQNVKIEETRPLSKTKFWRVVA